MKKKQEVVNKKQIIDPNKRKSHIFLLFGSIIISSLHVERRGTH